MFNEKQKQDYINYEGVNSITLEQYFKRIAPMERQYNKDITDMDADELKGTLSSLNIRREESRGHCISLLRGYINYMKLIGKTDNSSAINSITPESIPADNAIKSEMIKSADQLKEILDAAARYEYQDNRSIRDKLVMWLLYLGLTIEELRHLRKNALNDDGIVTTSVKKAKNDTVSIVTKKYKADENVLALWEECANMTFIEKDGSKYGKHAVNYELVDNEYMFRPIIGQKKAGTDLQQPCNVTFFASIVAKIFKNYFELTGNNILVSPLNMRNSGIFYRLNLEEANGKEITPEVIAEEFDIEYTSTVGLSVKTRKWRKDYDNWKLAFKYM